MNKKVFMPMAVLLVLAFSGCGLPSVSTSKSPKAGFTFSESIWKSKDGGNTWEVKKTGEGKANVAGGDVLSIATNPLDGKNVFVGLRQGGIMETTNGGESWKFLNFQSEKVYGLAVSYGSKKTLYASGVWQGTGKLFKTEDDGESWKEIYSSPSKGPLLISLTLDKNNRDVIYVTTSDREALKSSDGGATWKNIYLADAPILKIAVDAGNSNLVYLVTQSGTAFRSKNGGTDFENLNQKMSLNFMGIGGNQYTVLETDPVISGRVYLTGAGGLTTSKNGGENWEKINTLNNPQTFPIKALAINPLNSRELIYGASESVYKSEDGGANWKTSQFSNKMKVNVLEYNSQEPGIIYLGFIK